MRFGHVNLMVSDPQRSARFYAEHFGFVPAGEHDGFLVMQDEDGYDLVLESGEPAPGTFHFGFRSQSPADVEDARKAFETAGIEMFDPDEGGLVGFKIQDPDGYLVEVYSYP